MSCKKLNKTAIGWLSVIFSVIIGATVVSVLAFRPLSFALTVNGEKLCYVENRSVVDEALALLNQRLSENGCIYPENRNVNYKFSNSLSQNTVTAEECMELLYNASFQDYIRAYSICANGNSIVICRTYTEAQNTVSAMSDYFINQLKQKDDSINYELTTEFEIKNILCLESELSNQPNISDAFAEHVTIIKEPLENTFSFYINGLYAAVEYNSLLTETTLESMPFETIQIESDEIYEGQIKIVNKGEDGIVENTFEISYSNGVEVSRKLIAQAIISDPVDRVILIGTKPTPPTVPTGSFIWPIQERFYITSYFGEMRTVSSVEPTAHRGLDIACDMYTPIYAADGGTVIFSGEKSSFGVYVVIQHENGVQTSYAHMNRTLVNSGDKVYKGQQIGEIGMTGSTTGPHVHFEVTVNGTLVDPEKYLPKNK